MYLNRVLPNKNSIQQHICNCSRWKAVPTSRIHSYAHLFAYSAQWTLY